MQDPKKERNYPEEFFINSIGEVERSINRFDQLLKLYYNNLAEKSGVPFANTGEGYLILAYGQKEKQISDALKDINGSVTPEHRQEIVGIILGVIDFFERYRKENGILVPYAERMHTNEERAYADLALKFCDRLKSFSYIFDRKRNINPSLQSVGGMSFSEEFIPALSADVFEPFLIHQINNKIQVFLGFNTRRETKFSIPTPAEIHRFHPQFMFPFLTQGIKNPKEVGRFRNMVERGMKLEWSQSGCEAFLNVVFEVYDTCMHPEVEQLTNKVDDPEWKHKNDEIKNKEIEAALKNHILDNPHLSAQVKLDIYMALLSLFDHHADSLMTVAGECRPVIEQSINTLKNKYGGQNRFLDMSLLVGDMMMAITTASRRKEVFNTENISNTLRELGDVIQLSSNFVQEVSPMFNDAPSKIQQIFGFIRRGFKPESFAKKVRDEESYIAEIHQQYNELVGQSAGYWEANPIEYKKRIENLAHSLSGLVVSILVRFRPLMQSIFGTSMPNEESMLDPNVEPMAKLLNAKTALITLVYKDPYWLETLEDIDFTREIQVFDHAMFQLVCAQSTFKHAYIFKATLANHWPLVRDRVAKEAEEETGRRMVEGVDATNGRLRVSFVDQNGDVAPFILSDTILRMSKSVFGTDKAAERRGLHIVGDE